MRTLILGSSREAATSLGCNCVALSTGEWEIITSYQSSCAEWSKVPNVKKVTTYQDLKEEESESKIGLVLEVVAATFFEKPWVKARLEKSDHLIFITSSPVTFVPKTLYSSFHQIFVVKTGVPDKQSQYHTLFVDAKKHPFPVFKSTLKALENNHYLSISPDGTSITTGTWIASKVEPVESKVTGTIEKVTAPTPKVEPKVTGTIPTVTGTLPKVTGTIPNSPMPTPLEKKKPDQIVLPENMMELWVCFTAQPRKSEPSMLSTAITMFEEMLSNDLLLSMFNNQVSHHRDEEKQSVSIYFQVYKQRQDLFVALMMNVLQSLRMSHTISQGYIMI